MFGAVKFVAQFINEGPNLRSGLILVPISANSSSSRCNCTAESKVFEITDYSSQKK